MDNSLTEAIADARAEEKVKMKEIKMQETKQANYDANKEHINICKLKLRILENQLSKEWNNAGKEV